MDLKKFTTSKLGYRYEADKKFIATILEGMDENQKFFAADFLELFDYELAKLTTEEKESLALQPDLRKTVKEG